MIPSTNNTRKRSTMTLGIWSAMAILGLLGIQEARAQFGFAGPQGFYSSNGTVAIGNYKLPPTPRCPGIEPALDSPQYALWVYCEVLRVILVIGPIGALAFTNPKPLVRPVTPTVAQAIETSTL